MVAEYDPDFECEEPGLFIDPEYCMRYFRCDRNLEVSTKHPKKNLKEANQLSSRDILDPTQLSISGQLLISS